MKTAIVTFDNGDVITPGINSTDEEIREYYKPGRIFNLGDGAGGDLMARVYNVEIIRETVGLENMTKEEGRQIARDILAEAENIQP